MQLPNIIYFGTSNTFFAVKKGKKTVPADHCHNKMTNYLPSSLVAHIYHLQGHRFSGDFIARKTSSKRSI